MPFDNPCQTSVGDVELLWDAQRSIARRVTGSKAATRMATAIVSWPRCR
jgi:hypothetical protein